MGIKSAIGGAIGKAAGKAGNAVFKLSTLSPGQLKEVEEKRARYLEEMPSADDATAIEQTSRLIAAAGVEIYSAYLPQIGSIYLPIGSEAEYDGPFDAARNIRFLNITKWVSDPEENSLEKLVNVYDVSHSDNLDYIVMELIDGIIVFPNGTVRIKWNFADETANIIEMQPGSENKAV